MKHKGNSTRGPWPSEEAPLDMSGALTEHEMVRHQAISDCINTVVATLPARDGYNCCQGLRQAILYALAQLRHEPRNH